MGWDSDAKYMNTVLSNLVVELIVGRFLSWGEKGRNCLGCLALCGVINVGQCRIWKFFPFPPKHFFDRSLKDA